MYKLCPRRSLGKIRLEILSLEGIPNVLYTECITSINIHSFLAINTEHIHSQMSLISLFYVCKSVCAVLLCVHATFTTH